MKLSSFAFGATLVLGESASQPAACTPKLRVETFINQGPSLNVVSSLIIGSNASVLIDLPLAIPQAEALAQWVTNTTDKPLVAAFSTYSHPDHYLSGAAFLAHFPSTPLLASLQAASLMQAEAPAKVAQWQSILGTDSISTTPTIPTPYNSTFFALPGNEDEPIHLLAPLIGDTLAETLFWLPSSRTLIAGDTVYSHDMHLWLADMATPALTSTWLSTLSLIADLRPTRIIPGHAGTAREFEGEQDLVHSREYVRFFAEEIQARGVDFFTPAEIGALIGGRFPGLGGETAGLLLLNATSEQFGRGGVRQVRGVDLGAFGDLVGVEGWRVGGRG